MWGRNAPSAMEVARASGVIVLAAAQAGVQVEEYAPLEVKMAVTGVGNAPKEYETWRHVIETVKECAEATDAATDAATTTARRTMSRFTVLSS